MKIDSGMGYIFSKYEIIYIMCAMGVRYLFDENLKTDLSSKEIIEKAEKNLVEKNYVFKDISGSLVLNKEIIEYFKPVVSPKKVISCKKVIREFQCRQIFYMKNNVSVLIETESGNNENYIFTYISDNKEIYDYISAFCEIGKSGKEGINDKFIVTSKQYKLMQNMIKENDETGFELMLSDCDIKKELYGEMKAVFSNKGDMITFSLCSDCKTDKTEYLLYFITNDYLWAVIPNTYGNKSIRISSVTINDILNKISDLLNKKFNIKIDGLQQFFE